MATAKKAPKAKATKKTAPKAAAKKAPKAKPAKLDPIVTFKARYPHVVEVTEISTKGTPARVIIKCGCGSTRAIASQDAFQVRRCESCQEEHLRERRRAKAKARRAKNKTPKA